MKILQVFILTFFNFWIYAQDSLNLNVITKIDQVSKLIEVDKMGQIYLVTDDHSLLKYDAEGKFLKSFNENSLGAIYSVDVSNPFQPMLYFDEYQTVIVLDRSLSEMYRFNLAALNLIQVNAIGMSTDNMAWFYDPNSFKLKKINRSTTVELESPDLSGILDASFQPSSLRELNFNVYLNDPEKGIMVFDNFANYIRTIEVVGIKNFRIDHSKLYWLDTTLNLKSIDLKSFKEYALDLKKSNVSMEHLKDLIIYQDKFLLQLDHYILICAKL